jgi:probable HAF family extracellular repeat protein
VDDISYATEWSDGSVIDLGGLQGATFSEAAGINTAGQIVGYSFVDGLPHAIEWSGGNISVLPYLPAEIPFSAAYSINDAGQAVGFAASGVPEPSTWAMLLLGPLCQRC